VTEPVGASPSSKAKPSVSGSQWPAEYEIRVREVLNGRWSAWFEGLEVRDDAGETVISGPLQDESALHGVLAKVRDLGLHLIAVRRLSRDEERRKVKDHEAACSMEEPLRSASTQFPHQSIG
jgi:hypothetical protein